MDPEDLSLAKSDVSEIKLYKNQEFLGTLCRNPTGCEIVWDLDFFKNNLNQRITYNISVQKSVQGFVGVGLPPYFAGLLPEGLRLKALIKKVKTSADDLFTLLSAAGQDPVGDIHFYQKESPGLNEVELDFKKIKKTIKDVSSVDTTSLAGVQDKISADRLSLPLRLKNKNKSYLLKLASEDFSESLQNEMICLEIAKSCGLAVNKVQLIKDQNNIETLLVERFDRDWDKVTENWDRKHQEDACQFLDRYPADKYRVSFQEIAEGIQSFSVSPEIEILKLLQLKAFSYLIGNGDLHAKNVSLLNDQLSPCYDILCTAIYGDEKMALELDGKNKNLKRKNFVEFGMRYGIPQKATESMLSRLIIKFEQRHIQLYELSAAQKKRKYLEKFFAQRLSHLR